ncbi:MAG: transposase [Gallionella sp.]
MDEKMAQEINEGDQLRSPGHGTPCPYEPGIHRRSSIRLKGYDYSQAGAYFVTICAHDRKCLFGDVGARRAVPNLALEMVLNNLGEIVVAEWLKTARVHPTIELGEFVVMPNHFHGILILRGDEGTARRAPTVERFGKPTVGTVPTMIRSFKSAVTKCINEIRNTPGAPVWQRNYYEHVIRDEADYTGIAEYIANNPQRWAEDFLHPDATHSVNTANHPVGVRRAVPNAAPQI